MSRNRFNYNEANLRPGQKEAAIELVQYEFSGTKETADMPARKTKQEIADQIGISRKTLHEWDTKDTNFIAYKNKIASDLVNSKLATVYSRLMDNVEHGSMKAIEVYLKRIGDLDSRSEIVIHDDEANGESHEERRKAIMERLEEKGEE